uniref:Yippee like 1 n=1 Tax=Kryptolebias marmoratus TaxID=37003 RepID=A0A3Q2ZPT2_KRYMA
LLSKVTRPVRTKTTKARAGKKNEIREDTTISPHRTEPRVDPNPGGRRSRASLREPQTNKQTKVRLVFHRADPSGLIFSCGSVWSVPHTHSTTTTAFACIFQCFFCQQVQQSCNSSSASPDASEEPRPTDMVKMTKSKTFQAYLPSCHRTYSCIHCRAHLANHDELISKSFQGSQGRAYLFNSVVNVGCGPAEERVLLTGLHAVADIYCENCKTTLGWKYEHAFESSQKYKEGKFIIELAHMIKDNGWE